MENEMGLFDDKTQQTTNVQNEMPQQPQNNFDPFDVIGNAKASTRSVYADSGIYPILYLDSMKVFTDRKNRTFFVADFDILKSEVPSRPKGTTMSFMVNLANDAGPGNIREFIASLYGKNIEEVDPKTSRFACSEDNPCHGRLVRLEANIIKTKAGDDFTLHRWTPIPEEIQAKAAEFRQEAGFAAF